MLSYGNFLNFKDKMSKTQLGNIQMGLINLQKYTDRKINELNTLTINQHITFFTELNISNPEHQNIVTNDKTFTWKFMKIDFTKSQSRIGVRFPSKYDKFIKINLLDQGIYERPNRLQKSKSVLFQMTMLITIWNVHFKTILCYRCPDCDLGDKEFSKTKQFFDYVDLINPHIVLGDFNLNYQEDKTKTFLQNICKLKQVVNTPTRIAPTKNNKISSTLIDQVWAKFSIASKFKTKCLSNNISDHKMIQISIKTAIPPVKVELPVTLDKYRRYFPIGGVDWNKIRFRFSQDTFPQEDTDSYYQSLVNAIKNSCDEIGIIPRTKQYKKPVFRFSMSEQCRKLKREKIDKKFKHSNLTKNQKTDSSITNFKIEEAFTNYKKARNIYNRKVKQEQEKDFSKQFLKYKNDIKRLYSITNRAKGQVKGEVEHLEDDMFGVDSMGEFFQNRSKIATDIDFPKIPNTFPELLQANDNLPNQSIEINQDIIDEVMDYKPHSNPDPDGLSMMIWQKFYRHVPAARIAIIRLFYLVFNKSFKIPGLNIHHIKLHLKTSNPSCQKDIRPVASLNSIPKRMLKILYTQLKNSKIETFYSKNDYSGPGKGADLAVLSTYEKIGTMSLWVPGC